MYIEETAKYDASNEGQQEYIKELEQFKSKADGGQRSQHIKLGLRLMTVS